MTKLKAALAYETKKTACNLGLFVAGVAAFVGAVDLIALASGYPGMAFSGLYTWSFLFLGFATIVAFNRDWPFFLQNGLTRAQSFGVFAAMCVFSSVALALLDGVLSLRVSCGLESAVARHVPDRRLFRRGVFLRADA